MFKIWRNFGKKLIYFTVFLPFSIYLLYKISYL